MAIDVVDASQSTTLSNEYTVTRTSVLVDGGAQVGQLLARLPSFVARPASDFRYAPGCKLTASAGTVFTGPPEILFGVQRRPTAARGRSPRL